MSKKILQIILDLVNEAYTLSKDDRHKLHEMEWSSSSDTPSILGESEIRADAIIGIVKKYIETDFKNKDEILTILNRYSVYKSSALHNWLLDESENFKEFSMYLNILELLRLTLKEIISES